MSSEDLLNPNLSNFVSLNKNCSIKNFEDYFIYNKKTDELYEIDKKAFLALQKSDGTKIAKSLGFDDDFLKYCIDENLIELHGKEKITPVFVGTQQIFPSLRYLVIDITTRCNLECKHCYLDIENKKGVDLDYSLIEKTIDDFEKIDGLRLVISGGEPMMSKKFWQINDLIKNKKFRSILSTNGTLITENNVKKLNFDEVQISLDGLAGGHDFLRGRSTFDKAINAVELLKNIDKTVSVATMIHSKNINEVPEMKKFLNDRKIKSWIIDFPILKGRMNFNSELAVKTSEALPLLNFQFGSSFYSSSDDYACGAHLAALHTDGLLTKCGFYRDINGGYISKGLIKCWEDLPKIKIEELECGNCKFLVECQGGCRYRAEILDSRYAPDKLKCEMFFNYSNLK